MIATKKLSRSAIYYRSLSEEQKKELNKKKYQSALRNGTDSASKMRNMSDEERRAYNHERYVKHREEYIKRAREYKKMKRDSCNK